MHTWPIREFGKQTDVAISMMIESASLIGHALDLAIASSERFISSGVLSHFSSFTMYLIG